MYDLRYLEYHIRFHHSKTFYDYNEIQQILTFTCNRQVYEHVKKNKRNETGLDI